MEAATRSRAVAGTRSRAAEEVLESADLVALVLDAVTTLAVEEWCRNGVCGYQTASLSCWDERCCNKTGRVCEKDRQEERQTASAI